MNQKTSPQLSRRSFAALPKSTKRTVIFPLVEMEGRQKPDERDYLEIFNEINNCLDAGHVRGKRANP
jgi:hypothetical protein